MSEFVCVYMLCFSKAIQFTSLHNTLRSVKESHTFNALYED